jgi:hypothetical protein
MKFKNSIGITIPLVAVVLIGSGFYISSWAGVKEDAQKKLSSVKVISQYRRVVDAPELGRSLEDTIKIFQDTKTDFIFQGWMTQGACPDTCSDLPSERKKARCEKIQYSYEYLRNNIAKVKKEMPGVIFCGGTLTEFLYPGEVAGRDEAESRDKAWGMALDPRKWGLDQNKNATQCYCAKKLGFLGENEECPDERELKNKMPCFFPDLTNRDFREIFLKQIYKQIDCGVDAVWIDMLYVQAGLFKKMTGDENHPAVQDSYKAASEIVDRIHEYGLKKGKYIYVITWVATGDQGAVTQLHPDPNVDIAMATLQADEILDKKSSKIGQFNEKRWNEIEEIVKTKSGLPLFARIDYGGAGRTPLNVFSQELTSEEQQELLRKADKFFSARGIKFIYPVFGGDMGSKRTAKVLSYGKLNWYDSLAPEFQTYETIKELARVKAQN